MEERPILIRLTKKGYLRMRREFDYLSQKERPKIVQNVATAAAEGDRSENAEYIYGKKRLREIDRRLQYLSRLLKNPVIVDSSMVNKNSVSFGTKVTVVDDEGETKTWTIVGEGEADFKAKTISERAPVALALLSKCIGDIAEVELGAKTISLEITDITVGDID